VATTKSEPELQGEVAVNHDDALKDQLLQCEEELKKRIGKTCPDVFLDVSKRQIGLRSQLHFKGGVAMLLERSEGLMEQISKTVTTLRQVLLDHNGELFHIQFDGHVHFDKDPPPDTRRIGLIISYFRAAEVVLQIKEAGYPGTFLHPFAYGGTRPTGTAEGDRRVEIHIISEQEVGSVVAKGCALYGEIMEMPEFDKLVADEAFVKVRDGSNGTNIEHYRPYGCQCACKYDFNGDGVVSQEEVTQFVKSKK